MAETSPTCSISVAAQSGATIRMEETMRPMLSPAWASTGKTVSFQWNGSPIHGAEPIFEKSTAADETPQRLPRMIAVKYETITPMRIGMIFTIPFPNTEATITATMPASATGQQLDALFTATGESTRPMPMMIGPVTTGGKNFITVFTPNAFTREETTT